VDNSKIYSILSIGIHELDEDACLGYFDVMKQSIIFILDDDKRKKQELDARSQLAKTIAAFTPKPEVEP
jgi:hypothetical protein